MNRIETTFQHKPIFMPYFPLGYPTIESSIDILEALAKNGADLIEVGLAFSDPLADGPVIQQATQIALQNGITLKKALAGVAELRRRGVTIPLIMMGYYNPILSFGLKNYVEAAQSAGADGFIIPDLPPEEAAEFEALCSYLPLIRMLAPTTPSERMASIASSAKGFIYLVSVTGITGARQQVSAGLEELINKVKGSTSTPVCVGFGIGTPEQAKQVAAFADGVIVGSACVKTIGESKNPVEEAKKLTREFAEAISQKFILV
ncbi:MAG: tryptophan synthase subunit alpha [Anaerolineaceae bacterium]